MQFCISTGTFPPASSATGGKTVRHEGRSRTWRTIGALALAVLATAGASGSAAAAALPPDGVGVQFQAPFLQPLSTEELTRELDLAQSAGLTHARFLLRWEHLEPNAPGQWDTANLAKLDEFVNLANARGIKPLPIISLPPLWARGLLGVYPYSPPSDPAMLAGFAKRIATHLGSRVNTYEVWNEPNLFIFWGTQPDPARYTSYLKAAYPAIKQANPGATVLAAALSPEGDGLLSMSPTTFYRGMYQAGAKGYFDAAAAHPYTFYKPSAWTEDVDGIRQLMVANGDGHKKIWITETGASTGTMRPPGMTEEQQRDNIMASIAEAAARPFVGPLIIYCIRDYGTDRAGREGNLGILKVDFAPKLIHTALAELAG